MIDWAIRDRVRQNLLRSEGKLKASLMYSDVPVRMKPNTVADIDEEVTPSVIQMKGEDGDGLNLKLLINIPPFTTSRTKPDLPQVSHHPSDDPCFCLGRSGDSIGRHSLQHPE